MLNCDFFMQKAIKEAIDAWRRGSVPVGAVVAKGNRIVANAGNEVIKTCDPTAHAEILAIKRACSVLESRFLEDCSLYVTLEPCAMCAQAISFARVGRLYFGAYDEKYGGVMHGSRIFERALHKPEVIGGVSETKCGKILKDFFKTIRY